MNNRRSQDGQVPKGGGAAGLRRRFVEAARHRLVSRAAFLRTPTQIRPGGDKVGPPGGRHGADVDDHIRLAVREESAASLGRAGRRLREAVAALADFDRGREIGAPTTGAAATVAARAPLLADAARALWECVVQREAVGVTRHDLLDELYGVTPELWRLMGSPECIRGDEPPSLRDTSPWTGDWTDRWTGRWTGR